VAHHDTDLAIIGAGPAGLFAAYYAGFRGLRVAVVDSLPELGGQVTAMYPEKLIFDVAGFPQIKGRDLVANLVAQAAPSAPVTSKTETKPEAKPVDLSKADEKLSSLLGGKK